VVTRREQDLRRFQARLLDEPRWRHPDLNPEHADEVPLAYRRPIGHDRNRVISRGIGDD
jgi:hypothetical protein